MFSLKIKNKIFKNNIKLLHKLKVQEDRIRWSNNHYRHILPKINCILKVFKRVYFKKDSILFYFIWRYFNFETRRLKFIVLILRRIIMHGKIENSKLNKEKLTNNKGFVKVEF